MQLFASFEPFEIFDEFNGVQGTYIKSFLISDKINLNDWQATHEANMSNLDTFLGRPGIHYINPENGKLDHTGATTFEKSLQIQELYRAASIIAVGSDIPTHKNWQVSKMVDESVAEKIRSKEIKFISPSIWPKENAVETIQKTDEGTVDVVHDYIGLHYAFVDEPAFGVDAEIKSFCDGTTQQCQIELQKFSASINEVGPLIDKKIILPKEKKKNSSKPTLNTSHKNNSTSKTQMATEEELQKELEETKKALKATEEELEKVKDKEAKKATDLEDKEKLTKGKKATGDDEDDSEKAQEDDEEKKELKARIAALEKVPIVEKIISTQLSAGIISEDIVFDTTKQLMQTPLTQLSAVLKTSKSFEAKLNSLSANVNVPYMGSTGDGSFDASLDDIDDEQLLVEVSG